MLTVTSEIEFNPNTRLVGEAAVEIGERIVGFQTVHDIAVGERGQSIEFHVAISVRAADEIIAAPSRVDKGAGGELQGIGQVATRIRQVFQGRGSRVVEVFALSGLMSGASELTSTVSLDWATFSVKSTVCFWPRPAVTLSFCCGSNPAASTLLNNRRALVAGS